MMQSRLAATRWIASPITHTRFQFLLRSTTSTSLTADPNVHAGDPEGIDAEEVAKRVLAEQEQQEHKLNDKSDKNQQPLKPSSCFTTSPKIESTGVNNPSNPITQQKRHYQVSNPQDIKNVSCVGVDGYPDNGNDDNDRNRQEEEDKEYYKDHKPSPISEVEFADTRKPITQATDGTMTNSVQGSGSGDGGIITWREEQLESAEETLLRAMRMFKEAAMKGDPELPHSRALRTALRARGDEITW